MYVGDIGGDQREYTPLHVASSNNHVDVVKLLLNKNAIPNMRDKNGCTALHFAKTAQIAEVLCKGCSNNKGVNVNLPDIQNKTPLHYACRQGLIEVVEVLLRFGADPLTVDDYGQTALHETLNGLLIDLNNRNKNNKKKGDPTILRFTNIIYFLFSNICVCMCVDVCGCMWMHVDVCGCVDFRSACKWSFEFY